MVGSELGVWSTEWEVRLESWAEPLSARLREWSFPKGR